jgi:hypothetical protein
VEARVVTPVRVVAPTPEDVTPLTDVVTGARVICCVPLTLEDEACTVWLTVTDDRDT